MTKKIIVLVREGSFSHTKNTEALRVALGLTLGECEVTVLLMGDAVTGAGVTAPDILRRPPVHAYWDHFSVCGVSVLVDRPSKDAIGIKTLHEGAKAVERREILERMVAADAIVQV